MDQERFTVENEGEGNERVEKVERVDREGNESESGQKRAVAECISGGQCNHGDVAQGVPTIEVRRQFLGVFLVLLRHTVCNERY